MLCGIPMKTSHLETSVFESMALAIDSMALAKEPDDWIEVTWLTSVNESMALVNDPVTRMNESMELASDSFVGAKACRVRRGLSKSQRRSGLGRIAEKGKLCATLIEEPGQNFPSHSE